MREDWIFAILTKDLDYIKTGVSNYLGKKEYYSTGSIKNDRYTSEGMYSYTDRPSRANRCGQLGDVLQARMKDTDKAILIDEKFDQQLFSTGFIQIRPNPETLLSKYIYHYLKSILFLNSKDEICSGSTQSALNDENAQNILIPIAPIPIQRAIVAKIEELFSDLDKGIADLNLAKDQLAIFRQAVLKKAFEGELTKVWRENQTNLPTADELLEQIKEEREKHYKQQIEVWKKEVKVWEINGKKERKPSKPQNLVSYPEIEQNKYLPILNLGELVSQISIKLMPNDAPEMPFIGMDCIEKNALKPHFTYKFNEFKSAGNWFNINHILYGRMRPYLNKVYHAEYEGVASGEFIVLETTESILPEYLKLILHQQDFVHWSNRQSSGDKPRVKFEQIAFYNIIVPTAQEQRQIVKEIESRLSVCDKVELSIVESLEKAKALRQSILKKAFEGKLLSAAEIERCKQEEDYEPASVLLEKIKKEKKK